MSDDELRERDRQAMRSLRDQEYADEDYNHQQLMKIVNSGVDPNRPRYQGEASWPDVARQQAAYDMTQAGRQPSKAVDTSPRGTRVINGVTYEGRDGKWIRTSPMSEAEKQMGQAWVAEREAWSQEQLARMMPEDERLASAAEMKKLMQRLDPDRAAATNWSLWGGSFTPSTFDPGSLPPGETQEEFDRRNQQYVNYTGQFRTSR